LVAAAENLEGGVVAAARKFYEALVRLQAQQRSRTSEGRRGTWMY
jgi:hypothetical protein